MKIVFMGTPEFAVPSLNMLVAEGFDIAAVITQPDKPKGRGNRLTPPPVKEYAVNNGIFILQPEKIKTIAFADRLKEKNPDLLVTVAYGKILPGYILEVPPLGCINVHASLLPEYRGAAPINRAVMNGEKVTGVTTMFTDIGMDTGDMLLKSEVEITGDMTAGELHDILSVIGAKVLRETLKKLSDGTLSRIPQQHDKASYAPIMTKDTGRIDWSRPPQEIHNLVRGVNPWPGAFTFYKGGRMRIWKSATADGSSNSGRPGTICSVSRDSLSVACGKGLLDVLEIQFDSCKKMNVEECWHNIVEGEVLE